MTGMTTGQLAARAGVNTQTLRYYERRGLLPRPARTRAEVLAVWNDGWSCVYSALEPLTDADLARSVRIRGERHSVMQAIHRQLAHYAYHCGQIVFLAKYLQSGKWKSLSIPRGQSQAFAAKVRSGELSQR